MKRGYCWIAAAAFLSLGLAQCPPEECPYPLNGPMIPGIWGGDNWIFQVDEMGYISIETHCGEGVSQGPVYAEYGEVAFEADMYYQMGPTVPGVAGFIGTVCGDAFEFTYYPEDGESETGLVLFGEQGNVEPCLIL